MFILFIFEVFYFLYYIILGSGVLSASLLQQAMKEVLTEEQVQDLIRDADNRMNGQIDYADFIKRMMGK